MSLEFWGKAPWTDMRKCRIDGLSISESHPCCFLMLDMRDRILPHFSKNKSRKTGKEAKEKKEDRKSVRLKDQKRWNSSKAKENGGSLDIRRQQR